MDMPKMEKKVIYTYRLTMKDCDKMVNLFYIFRILLDRSNQDTQSMYTMSGENGPYSCYKSTEPVNQLYNYI